MKVTDILKPEINNQSVIDVNDMLAVERRFNNSKRGHIYVNKYLGKHYPMDAESVLNYYEELYQLIKSDFDFEKTMIVGFTETATAIAQYMMARALDDQLDVVYYAQTTREDLPGDRIAFLEEHSHAPDQYIHLPSNLSQVDSILFVEDEISSGKTVLNFIDEFEKLAPGKRYAVASPVNFQNTENRAIFQERDIQRIALLTGELNGTSIESDHYDYDESHLSPTTDYKPDFPEVDPRRGMTSGEFHKWVAEITTAVLTTNVDAKHIIGTEEFMFPALLLAGRIGATFRATTRSPIVPGETLTDAIRINSAYGGRVSYLYNNAENDQAVVVTDIVPDPAFDVGAKQTITLRPTRLVETSYSQDDVTILLQDVRGKVPILGTAEREVLIQQGTHYSEMLPLEYVPTDDYFRIYNQSLDENAALAAEATARLSDKIIEHTKTPVLVSLARAGTPVGILLRRYIKRTYGIDAPHYSISIIRGKGIDVAAMKLIAQDHDVKDIVFVDGWVGKGAITRELGEAVQYLKDIDDTFAELSPELAVLTDPAGVTELYGTRHDFLIPSACLNATVSGLFSRTVKTKAMGDHELHGAVYYGENSASDVSNQFIDKVDASYSSTEPFSPKTVDPNSGIEEVKRIAQDYGVRDINKVKPGLGETTRVLLRRVPECILVDPNADRRYLQAILQLAKERNVPVVDYPMTNYTVCGVIKDVIES